jgi:rhamnulokinase
VASVAAVDIGATSGRVMLAGLVGGVPSLAEVARFDNGPFKVDGRWTWNTYDLFTRMLGGLETAVLAGARSWGIDTWAVDYGVIDSTGTLTGPVVAYRDPGHDRGVARVRERMAWEEQYAATGIQHMPFNTVYQLAAEEPGRIGEGCTLLLVPDLLSYWATGTLATDVTNASSTGLVDPRTRDWSPVMLDMLGLPRSAFLPTDEPGLDRGPALDKRLGGLPLIGVATHDTASAFAGCPIVDRDRCLVLSLGTWALIGYESTDATPSEASMRLNVTHELGVDLSVRVLRNVTGMWLFEECRRAWGLEDGTPPRVPDLIAAMESAPAFAAAFDVDADEFGTPGQSSSTIAPHLVGGWDGSRAAMVRAILESVVCRLARRARELDELGGRERPILHVVGGATRIGTVMQWLADATGKQVVAGPVEATALGNACVQWVSSGVMSDMGEARAAIAAMPEVRIFEPRAPQAPWLELAARIEGGRT